ncbi:MAG TPA: methyltransferase domain-containing protein [Rhizomicrobium sp.]
MARFKPLSGGTVLEVGADADGLAAEVLLAAGAGKVISTNYVPSWPASMIRGAVELRRADARDLAATIAPESVDFVFGIAVLEHIDGLAAFFAGARQVLKPGGLFCVHGGPIWTSAAGHHVFVKGEKMHYRFGIKEANPVPKWAHLTNTRDSLAELLIAREVYPPDAEAIAQNIYFSHHVNRVGYATMCETFSASPLNPIDRIEAVFQSPPDDVLAAIERGRYGDQKRYDISGLTFVAN